MARSSTGVSKETVDALKKHEEKPYELLNLLEKGRATQTKNPDFSRDLENIVLDQYGAARKRLDRVEGHLTKELERLPEVGTKHYGLTADNVGAILDDLRAKGNVSAIKKIRKVLPRPAQKTYITGKPIDYSKMNDADYILESLSGNPLIKAKDAKLIHSIVGDHMPGLGRTGSELRDKISSGLVKGEGGRVHKEVGDLMNRVADRTSVLKGLESHNAGFPLLQRDYSSSRSKYRPNLKENVPQKLRDALIRDPYSPILQDFERAGLSSTAQKILRKDHLGVHALTPAAIKKQPAIGPHGIGALASGTPGGTIYGLGNLLQRVGEKGLNFIRRLRTPSDKTVYPVGGLQDMLKQAGETGRKMDIAEDKFKVGEKVGNIWEGEIPPDNPLPYKMPYGLKGRKIIEEAPEMIKTLSQKLEGLGFVLRRRLFHGPHLGV